MQGYKGPFPIYTRHFALLFTSRKASLRVLLDVKTKNLRNNKNKTMRSVCPKTNNL
jgi:hypothetical protein